MAGAAAEGGLPTGRATHNRTPPPPPALTAAARSFPAPATPPASERVKAVREKQLGAPTWQRPPLQVHAPARAPRQRRRLARPRRSARRSSAPATPPLPPTPPFLCTPVLACSQAAGRPLKAGMRLRGGGGTEERRSPPPPPSAPTHLQVLQEQHRVHRVVNHAAHPRVKPFRHGGARRRSGGGAEVREGLPAAGAHQRRSKEQRAATRHPTTPSRPPSTRPHPPHPTHLEAPEGPKGCGHPGHVPAVLGEGGGQLCGRGQGGREGWRGWLVSRQAACVARGR